MGQHEPFLPACCTPSPPRQEFYTKGSLKGANFSGSNLSGCAMFGSNLEEANMRGTHARTRTADQRMHLQSWGRGPSQDCM